jgi:hypothetical protein
MRTTIRMNEELARRAKARAAQSGRSFTQLVEQAVSEYLDRPEKPRRKNRVNLPTFGDPRKKITWEQYRAAVERAQLEDDLKSLGMKPE